MKSKQIYKTNAKNTFKNIIHLIIFIVIAEVIFFSLKGINNKMIPSVISMTDSITKNKINELINISLKDSSNTLNLKSTDFYTISKSENGKINSLSVNTMLVNDFCNEVAVKISKQMQTFEKEKISIPLGTLTGIELLYSRGPNYVVTIVPMGNAVVDYESSFVSVGINQINFEIWLNIDIEVKIVNTLQKNNINFSRKISLINTVINSEVPNNNFNSVPNPK